MPNIQQTLPTEATSPEASITAEKERTKTLARWISTALATLETIDPDDMEDGGTGMRSLIADGQSLVSAVLQGRDLVPDRRKVQTANHPMRRATDWPQLDVALGAVPLPTANSPEMAGMQSAIGHLSRLVVEQRALLVEVEDVCGRDGLGGTLEDGESELIDKVRRHLDKLNAPETSMQPVNRRLLSALAKLVCDPGHPGYREQARAAIAEAEAQPTEAEQPEPRVEFYTDEPVQSHSMSIAEAARVLSAFFTEFPGGVEEMQSAQPVGREPLSDSERAELEHLRTLVNTPELHSFRDGVVLEAAHQRERWGSVHDAGKQPSDWFWLVGYLAGKALHAQTSGNTEKALHHTISTAAALANWHAAISGESTAMRPGIDPASHGITGEGM